MRPLIAGCLLALITSAPVMAESVKLRAEKVDVFTSDKDAKQKDFMILLTPESARRFGPFSARHVGQNVNASIAGKYIGSPRIETPLSGRMLLLTGPYPDAEITAAKERMLSTEAVELSSQEPYKAP